MISNKYEKIETFPEEYELQTVFVINCEYFDQHTKDSSVSNFKYSVSKMCKNAGLTVSSTCDNISVKGLYTNFQKLFAVQLTGYKCSETDIILHQCQSFEMHEDWNDKIIAILGLNTYTPHIKPYYHLNSRSHARAPIDPSFTPIQLAKLYDFPDGDGNGQKIGIIELGGGYTNLDLTNYMSYLGLNSIVPNVTSVSVNGATNNPSDTSGANYEVVLDIDVILAIVPKAAIRVYFAPNSDSGFYNAIQKAITDKCNAISISWGAPEQYWSTSTMNAYNALFKLASDNGIAVAAAAGDNGSSDGAPGLNVDFPASSPYVIACGGTTLDTDTSKLTITSEIVWNHDGGGTGGGLSKIFTKPSYQNGIAFTLNNHRGVPDIAANADPSTGYKIYIDGQINVIGGTSAVSPLIAALVAICNTAESVGTNLIHTRIYSIGNVCRDIIQGSNGFYNAASSWDPTTGLGVPIGSRFRDAILGIESPVFDSSINASFTVNHSSGKVPLRVKFTDTSVVSPSDNTIAQWLWNFGNSVTSTATNPQYQYKTAGKYTVTLKVTDKYGNSDTVSHDITVTKHHKLSEIVANFGIKQNGNSRTFYFQDKSTQNPTKWHWNFGDGTSSTAKNPFKTYNHKGLYNISLTVSNGATRATIVKQLVVQ